jgi:hypothetical protein
MWLTKKDMWKLEIFIVKYKNEKNHNIRKLELKCFVLGKFQYIFFFNSSFDGFFKILNLNIIMTFFFELVFKFYMHVTNTISLCVHYFFLIIHF